MLRKIYLAIALIAFTYSVKAEGYAVNVQGAKQTGMGHVGVAINWDASSMQFNPGALATLDAKYSLSMGGSLVWSNTEYTNLSSSALNTETDNPIATPFYLYGSAKLTDKLAVGLAVYTPFGSSNIWGDTWAGKYLIQEITMKSIYIQPTVSYQVNDWMSVGAGLNIVYGDFKLNKAFPILPNPTLPPSATNPIIADGGAELSGNTIKYGYNLGVFLQPTEKLNIGISYRSKVDIELDDSEGEGTFSFPSTVPPALVAGYKAGGVTDGTFTATLPLPASLNVGFAYQIDEKWLVSADVNFVEWSVYKNLEFVSKDAAALNSLNKRDWDNSMTYRIGAQYSANEKLDLRAGFYYDETPTNDKFYAPETPGADKIGITGGFSYLLNEKFSIDAAFIYSKGEKIEAYDTNTRSQGFGGEYQNTAFIPSVGITYNF
ncbi:transporter [Ancylomarina euxinus]|uniref:Transporter n=1 Tax=Ancylomarina euxinus TaxID=2283627 RepID=A0A425Y002_9BACT|nr:OmpP1/FadL family transporter [Ancylomarina euxinus]MCZ4695459.1 OmpP1/FadL family transporter [Ancylomarina euxinus]MUP15723.1 hydrocarbon degradation protein [Ancylomarina euxinus]RRG20713.1 transporter [Ancylomarina euxinus]